MAEADVREIQLIRGGATLVDAEDFERWGSLPWLNTVRGYAYYSDGTAHFLHRLICDPPAGMLVDHINGDTLDNRRANLRPCTAAQNSRNRAPRRGSSTGFKGVVVAGRRFRASITFERAVYKLGVYDAPETAARAYDEAAIRLHGEFARLNFPEAT